MDYRAVIKFWFEEIETSHWFRKDLNFDLLIRERFLEIHTAATKCELYDWRKTPLGRLAEVIVLDQYSRNIYRDTAQAFAYDAQALCLAQQALCVGAQQTLSSEQKSFLFMPFMHSESKKIHQIAIQLFDEPGMESNLNFERRHQAIIDRFGRYPHRNGILGRASTEEELAFLQTPGSSF